MGFGAHVEDINNAAATLSGGDSPTLSAGGAPNVGETDGAALFTDSYGVWLATRKEDLQAAEQQVSSLVKCIKSAAASYDGDDGSARDTFMTALDSGFDRIDR